MGKNSKIEWTATKHPDGTMKPGYTINLWWGCVKIENNPLCDNCYAATWDKRTSGKDSHHWGNDRPRRAIKSAFGNLDKWQRKAAEAGEYHKVFTMSMGDIFERNQPLETPLQVGHNAYTDTEQLRNELFGRILDNRYPNLVFLMLTKRPQNVLRMVPDSWLTSWPHNVWVGTSAGDQENVDRLIPHLLKIPAPVRFVSAEPLMEAIDLRNIPTGDKWSGRCEASKQDALSGHTKSRREPNGAEFIDLHSTNRIEWVIAGGESGHHARAAHPDWYRSLRDECNAAGVPYHFKQWGEWLPRGQQMANGEIIDPVPNRKPHDPMYDHVGKKAAGRTLDGRTHDDDPITAGLWKPQVAIQ